MATKEDNLAKAAKNGDLKEVKRLVESGADIHAGDDYALKLASWYNYLEVVKYLVEQGADIHAGNDYVLRWARYNDHTSVAEYLTYCKSLYYKMKIRRK